MYYDLLLHVDTDEDSLKTALRNAENYMKAGIDAEYTIAIVINGKAVELLRRETCHHTEAITKLISSRVRLFVCSNALKERNISETDIISGATFVPAGIVHLVKLQREGFVYVKP